MLANSLKINFWSRDTNALDRFPILMLLYFPIVQSSYGKSPSHLMSAMYSRFLRWQSPEESHIPLVSSLPFVPRSCLNWISYSDKPSTISRKAGPLVPRSEHFLPARLNDISSQVSDPTLSISAASLKAVIRSHRHLCSSLHQQRIKLFPTPYPFFTAQRSSFSVRPCYLVSITCHSHSYKQLLTTVF